MDAKFTVNLSGLIESVAFAGDYGGDVGTVTKGESSSTIDTEKTGLTQDLKAQQNLYSELCRTLKSLLAKLNRLYDDCIAAHKEEIAKLSVEIARKVLVQKVEEGDYEIESIIKEALGNAPTHQDLVVHLNQQDLAQFDKVRQNSTDTSFDGIKFVADSNIGRAECVLHSPKGIIESLIEKNLEQIAQALQKAK